MVLPRFRFLKPQTLAEALELLVKESGAFPIAGGTNLMVDVREGKLTPETVIDLSSLDELRGIEAAESEITIGGAVTIAELLSSPVIEKHAPVLFVAAKTFANTLIRNRATVGGNLANAAPCADTAPALLVLNAEVELSSSGSVRWLPLGEFLVGAFKTQRRRDELLTKVRFPIPPASSKGGFQKMGLRKISCMAKVDVAVYLDFDESGTCAEARIAHGAASAVALRVPEAEAILVGHSLTLERIDEAAQLTEQSAQPRSGSEYKRQVVYGLTRRILTKIATRGEKGETT
ncbi:xanthine dehydrogenase family protein subunit M [Candidatus Bipolaricaulota bacterium]|nr:xanthine dehydrogenase family protein subunit M [Candidatus Bipolaricaulota bacterium]